jgi:hypothetical protein
MAEQIDARTLLGGLRGQLIHTISGQPNRVLRIDDDHVVVATTKSPQGQAVPIAWVQSALERLLAEGSVEISVPSVGYRSAFVGAVLSTVDGVVVERRPQLVRLLRRP